MSYLLQEHLLSHLLQRHLMAHLQLGQVLLQLQLEQAMLQLHLGQLMSHLHLRQIMSHLHLGLSIPPDDRWARNIFEMRGATVMKNNLNKARTIMDRPGWINEDIWASLCNHWASQPN
jgi:hypothetical protein